MIEDMLEAYLAEIEETDMPICETKDAKKERAAAVRAAVKTIIEGCGVTCSGCPIRVICRTQFKTEPWTWGVHRRENI